MEQCGKLNIVDLEFRKFTIDWLTNTVKDKIKGEKSFVVFADLTKRESFPVVPLSNDSSAHSIEMKQDPQKFSVHLNEIQ